MQFGCLDAAVEFLYVVCVEGRHSYKQLVEHRAKLVHVRWFAHARFGEHFGRQVGRTPAEALRVVGSFNAFLREPEIGKLAVPLGVNQNVLRLEVPVNDI